MKSKRANNLVLVLLICMMAPLQHAFAAPCVLDDQSPFLGCPFTEDEKKSIKFGSVSAAFGPFNSGGPMFVRFNQARYAINIGTIWVEEDGGGCDVEDVDSSSELFELRDIINFSSNSSDIAFMVNPDDVREITKVWILDCKVMPDIR